MLLERLIHELPADTIKIMRRDLFGGFASLARYWSLYDLVDHAGNLPGYRVSFHRGTLAIDRHGQALARLALETEAEWLAAEAVNNPTGRLEDAPAGVPRILCVCTFGLETGVELRLRAECLLRRRFRMDAWLETLGIAEAPSALPFADLLLVTDDEASAVVDWDRPRVVVSNYVRPAELSSGLGQALRPWR
jgi:hypothetical protein